MMMMASGGRAVAAMAAAAAVALLMMAGGADADCFDYCYKNCIANDKSMADYCNYACDKTCEPGLLRQRPLAAAVVGGTPLRCQINCVRRTCSGLRKDRMVTVACYGNCFNGCKTKAGPRPLRAGQPFHEKQDAVQPALVPDEHRFHEKKDDVRPATVPDRPFHEKQDAVQPAAVPDHP